MSAAAAAAPDVRRHEDAESGFAMMMEQFLRQSLEESDEKRRRAEALRGRIAMTASDYEQTVTLVFAERRIEILDGAQGPLDAAINGPYDTLVHLLQGESSPLLAHLRGRIRVRSSLRKPFLPLHVHNLMKLEPEGPGEPSGFVGDIADVAVAGLAVVIAVVLLLQVT